MTNLPEPPIPSTLVEKLQAHYIAINPTHLDETRNYQAGINTGVRLCVETVRQQPSPDRASLSLVTPPSSDQADHIASAGKMVRGEISSLLPCPFCGSEADYGVIDGAEDRHLIACMNLGCFVAHEGHGGHPTAEIAAAMWNRRTTKPVSVKRVREKMLLSSHNDATIKEILDTAGVKYVD